MDVLARIRQECELENVAVMPLHLENQVVSTLEASPSGVRKLLYAKSQLLDGLQDMSDHDVNMYAIWFLAKFGDDFDPEHMPHFTKIERLFECK
jgi:hypothetical protein